ncbi:G-type lectin S-receptor-like serine/threonine-protein kinase LECRK3 [Eucalyptus grandis]|uniref:G-type lectin S-receptor-like serine/threonine-protein kinase LECRK3 n=1 Tax=Eucalyptus grandis TaxID=71139 RepID=UPI00192F0E01|nr:G-type lectin S-receptor-like serine/threonine-protein kinase LECRK3 [Eucalyptus grandis]
MNPPSMSPVSIHHTLFFLLFLIPRPSLAQENIPVGSSLTATNGNSSSWLSPSGDFAFGFHSLSDGDTKKNQLFLLAIWYNKIPSKTIVWFANEDRPAPENSKLTLDSDSGLVLTNPQGGELWKPDTVIGTVSHAVLNDTGNFMILDSSSDVKWQSFDNPCDTLLPSQVLGKGKSLSSRQSEESFSRGRFQLRMRESGDLVLNTINLPSDYANEAYYSTGTDGSSNASTAGKELVFSNSGSLFVSRANGERLLLSQGGISPASDSYHRVTLNFDGVLTQYVHPKNSGSSGSWATLWSQPDDICAKVQVRDGIGVCGYNSICTMGENNRPKCDCPEKFTLLDPSDKYGSCRPNFTQSCADDQERTKLGPMEDLYGFEELMNTDWPTSDYALLQPFGEEECRNSCLHDCMCAVAVWRGGQSCWKKKLPLSNGKINPTLNGKAMIKVPKRDFRPTYFPLPEPKARDKEPKSLVLVGSVLLGSSVFVNFVLFGACMVFFLIYRKQLKKVSTKGNVVETNLRHFTYQELFRATDGFKEELGRGAFGIVYKGVISNNVAVAVKKLSSMMQDKEKEFRTEVNVIGQTHHKNLVRLHGFCDEGQERLLVYEFLSNGSLSDLLFAGDPRLKTPWNLRCQIALGVARGLMYLHDECPTQIIHCDIKPQNILLDNNCVAKISDFGMAKLLMMNQSYTKTNVRGTRGYVAPEWFRNLPITVKVDVYSFGVLLLEIISCRSCLASESSGEEREIDALTDWAYDRFMEGRLDALVEGDAQALRDTEKLKNLVMVAFWCIQEEPSLRPTMRKVTQMLEGAVGVPDPPCPFPFSSCNTTIVP